MKQIFLPYLNNQQKLNQLKPLLQRPWAMLLDSAGNNSNYNRFDILCFEPTVKFSFRQNKINLESTIELPKFKSEQPLVCLRQLLAHFKPKQPQPTSELPFSGGWLGYISYDFGRQLEKLPSIAVDDIDLPQLQMGLYQWALITDHQEKTTRLLNFGLADQYWKAIIQVFKDLKLLPSNLDSTTSETLTNHLATSSEETGFSLTRPWQSNTSSEEYKHAFNTIQNYIHSGDCYQVNFAQRFTAHYQGSIVDAYEKLTQVNQAPFSAFLNFEAHQILSLSPERFIECHQGKVTTQPIKGTRPRKQDPIKDEQQANQLKNSTKDKAENLMIVDLLRNDLSRTAAKGSVKVTELFGHYRFASVHHLISTIESRLDSTFDNFDLLATTLPGGSITGAPKIRAMEIIEELEPVRRNLYCGVIGYIDFNGNMDTNICIRTLIAQKGKLHCWAGGGLVADSDENAEYQETFDKLSKILPILE